jgi:hypothetical protein
MNMMKTTEKSNQVYDLKTYLDFSKLNDAEYLKSKHIKKCVKSEHEFVLKYDKDFLTHDNKNTLGLFRSIVIMNGKVVGFAPPKSISPLDNEFKSVHSKELGFEEFVEGTMMNMFYANDEWQIATRSNIGAKNKFFKNSRQFYKLFNEIMEEKSIPYDKFNNQYCYSFVMQHPENRIVSIPKEKRLVVCGIYKCNPDFTIENISVMNDWYTYPELYKFVSIPKMYTVKTFEEAIMKYANPSHKTDYNIMGFVMRNGLYRAKYRNPEYENARRLRGNQPKIQFQYLNLRRHGRVHEFLKYFPDYSEEFENYRKEVHYFTQTLHKYYIDCFIYKTQPLSKYGDEYRPHLYKLHNDYLNILRPNKQTMSFSHVISYVNNLESERLMFAINYKHRDMVKKHEQSTVASLEQAQNSDV